MGKLLELLEKLVRAIFGPGDKQDAEEAKPAPEPPEPPGAEAVTGWEGDPPYRFVDVSRWQGKIKMEGWQAIKGAGYKGVMLRACGNSASYNPSKAYIDPTFETNYANAKAAGLDGVVCSAEEASVLKGLLGAEFKLVTPGIRPSGSAAGDQRRVMTPLAAVEAGADYLVIGRPITQSSDPAAVLGAINAELCR